MNPGLTVRCPVCHAQPQMRCLRNMYMTTTVMPGYPVYMRSNDSHKARIQLEEKECKQAQTD